MNKEGRALLGSGAAVVLCDVRSAQNVGSIFRTADGAGVFEIVLVGYTPTPIDRFGRARRDIAKAALGAERSVSWRHEPSIHTVIEEARAQGKKAVAVEQHPRSVPISDFKPSKSLMLIFGNETDGLPEDVIAACSDVIEIPLSGVKESLNVSVAAGIVLFTPRQ